MPGPVRTGLPERQRPRIGNAPTSSLPVTFLVWGRHSAGVVDGADALRHRHRLADRELSSPDYSWVWLSEFIDLFLDRRFLNAVWVSVKWEIVTVIATMVVAIGLGVLMFEVASPRLRNIYCLLFIIPVLLPSRRPSCGSSPIIRFTASPPTPTG